MTLPLKFRSSTPLRITLAGWRNGSNAGGRAGVLDGPRARPGVARRTHPAGRRHRPHPAAGPVGAGNRLPLDQLKIDQGFVRDMLQNPNDAAIAGMVVALGTSLKLAVIAEGVETRAQRDFLASQGCYTYQGYLFSRPVAVAKFEVLALELAIPLAPLPV